MSVADQPVNRNPGQLLRYLGLSGPDAPNRLANEISGQVDLLPWWNFANEQTLNFATSVGIGVTGIFAPSSGLVPPGANWLVSMFSLQLGTPAATNVLQVQGALFESSTALKYPVGPVSQTWTNAGAGALDVLQGGRERWLIVPTGFAVGFNVEVNTGTAATSVRLLLRYTQFSSG